jgi:hypothetical protein
MASPSLNRPINQQLAYARSLLASLHVDDTPRTEAARNAPRCAHVNSKGYRCGSPALRAKDHCYFHDRARNRSLDDGFPALDDANSVQMAVMQVLDALRRKKIDRLTAQTYFAGLRVAAMLTQRTVVSDPDRVVVEDPEARPAPKKLTEKIPAMAAQGGGR